MSLPSKLSSEGLGKQLPVCSSPALVEIIVFILLSFMSMSMVYIFERMEDVFWSDRKYF